MLKCLKIAPWLIFVVYTAVYVVRHNRDKRQQHTMERVLEIPAHS